jgi:hypothetical protein
MIEVGTIHQYKNLILLIMIQYWILTTYYFYDISVNELFEGYIVYPQIQLLSCSIGTNGWNNIGKNMLILDESTLINIDF